MQYKLIDNSLNDIYNPIKTVLLNRGVTDINTYLNLNVSVVQNYNDLNNIQEAVQCFVKHFEQRDKIVVLPDEDSDGYTSSAMLYLYIKLLDPDYPVEYVMHTKPKMHGISNNEYLKIPKDTKLFIMADAGVNDAAECNKLIEQGTEVIILDHHDSNYQEESEEEINYQTAEYNNAIIVNNQLSDKYINKNLSGAGVTYRFLQALDDEFWEDYADNFLDLVAVGNVADVMDMRNFETRYLVNRGLKSFNNKFLVALAKAQEYSMKGQLSVHNVAWYIAPVLNAITRIGSPEERELVFRAMIEQDEMFTYDKRNTGLIEENIYDRAARIAKNAKSRQDKQRDKVFDELKNKVDLNDKVLFLESELGQGGLMGLSAMKLADKLKRPVIVVKAHEKDGEVIFNGSCRNYDNSPISNFKDLILKTNAFIFCSGHGNAAGLAIKADNVELAKEQFELLLKDVDFNVPIACDFVMDIEDLDINFIQEIDRHNWLWGTGLKEPKVCVTDITIKRSDAHIQGKDHNSVYFMIDDIKFVQFNMSSNNPLLEWVSEWGDDDEELTLTVVGEASINDYKNQLTPQFIIQDLTIQD